MSFPFPRPKREAREQVSEPLKLEQASVTEERKEEQDETTQSPTIDENELSLQKEVRDDHWSLSSSQAPDERSFIIPEETRFKLADNTIERDQRFEEEWPNVSSLAEEKKSSSPLDPNRERAISVIPFISLCWALLLVFSLITLVHRAQPSTIETMIGMIPWLGSYVLRNTHLQRAIVLQSVRPSLQTIMGNREVFVISGVAFNRNPVSVREVRVEGYIFNAAGKEIERQAISVGNAISSKIIRDLTSQEISILQKLNPQRRFEIPPEESASFVIVFLKPRGEIKAFSCRVVSAQST